MNWNFPKGASSSSRPGSERHPGDYGLAYEEVYFEAEDGVRLNGWWLLKEGAPVLLWFHGNAGNISHRLENLNLLHRPVRVQVSSSITGNTANPRGGSHGKAL